MSYKTVPNVDKVCDRECDLKSGEIIGGAEYTVVKKLGAGAFANVYLVNSGNKSHALKVYGTGKRNLRYYHNEVRMLNILQRYIENNEEEANLIKFKGTFAHVYISADLMPRVYPCVKFKLMGDHLGRFLRKQVRDHDTGFGIEIARGVIRQVLTALKFLHTRGIIHTDIKPENIFLECEVGERLTETTRITVGDLGTSTFSDELFSNTVGTTQYMAPELVLELKYTSAIDIWAAFTMCYELVTGDLLFDVFNENSVYYGSDMSFASGDSEGSSQTSDYTETNYAHLMLMEKVLGKLPKALSSQGRTYYNNRGNLKNNPEIEPSPLLDMLIEQYEMQEEFAKQFEEFLLLGLQYLPEKRITADDALKCKFLN